MYRSGIGMASVDEVTFTAIVKPHGTRGYSLKGVFRMFYSARIPLIDLRARRMDMLVYIILKIYREIVKICAFVQSPVSQVPHSLSFLPVRRYLPLSET